MAEGRGLTVVLLGGMGRLERRYAEEAANCGVALKVFNTCPARLSARIGNAGALVLFTNRISHRARREAVSAATSRRIAVLMCRSCGICTFRKCLERLPGITTT